MLMRLSHKIIISEKIERLNLPLQKWFCGHALPSFHAFTFIEWSPLALSGNDLNNFPRRDEDSWTLHVIWNPQRFVVYSLSFKGFKMKIKRGFSAVGLNEGYEAFSIAFVSYSGNIIISG